MLFLFQHFIDVSPIYYSHYQEVNFLSKLITQHDCFYLICHSFTVVYSKDFRMQFPKDTKISHALGTFSRMKWSRINNVWDCGNLIVLFPIIMQPWGWQKMPSDWDAVGCGICIRIRSAHPHARQSHFNQPKSAIIAASEHVPAAHEYNCTYRWQGPSQDEIEGPPHGNPMQMKRLALSLNFNNGPNVFHFITKSIRWKQLLCMAK